jgi:transposase
MRGKRPGPVKKIFRHLCYLSRIAYVNISVIKVDEYLTSQLCALCDQCNLQNLSERSNFDGSNSDTNIHALLKCQNCRKVWNHDQMAAKNVHYIFDSMATNNNRRLLF